MYNPQDLNEIDPNENWDAKSEEEQGYKPPVPSWAANVARPFGRGRGRGFEIQPPSAQMGAMQLKNNASSNVVANSSATPQELWTIGFGRGRGRGRGFLYNPTPESSVGLLNSIEPANGTVPGVDTVVPETESVLDVAPPIKDVILPAPDLATLLQSKYRKDKKFNIVNYSHKVQNRVHIMTKVNRRSAIVGVLDEMHQHTRVVGKLQTKPKLGDLIVILNPDWHNHIRAYVIGMHDGDDGLVMVQDVDRGRIHALPWREMWPPNDAIISFRNYGYEVELDGVEAYSPLILMDDYYFLMEDLIAKSYNLKIVGETVDGIYKVQLIKKSEAGTHKFISTWINELKKWEWENILDLGIYRTDVEIIERSKWKQFETYYSNAFLPQDMIFQVEVVGSTGADFENNCSIFVKPLHEYMESYENTLKAQLERYMSMVKPQMHYPGIMEEFFAKLPATFGCGDKWQRMFRLDQSLHAFYNVDTHHAYEIDPGNEEVLSRKMCPEFFRIPKLLLECNVVSTATKDELYERVFKKVFGLGKKLWVKILEADQDENYDWLVQIRCKEFDDSLDLERKVCSSAEQETSVMDKPILYSFARSSCAWRVRIALVYKGIDFTLKTVDQQDFDQRSSEYLKINPLGQVPALVEHGTPICDSFVILEYLEEKYPNKPLMPKDTLVRAKVRQVCQLICSFIQPLQNPSVARMHSEDGMKQSEWIVHHINKGFMALEKVLEESAGKFCVGNELSLADVCLVPQVFNAEMRFKMDIKPYPTLQRIYHALSELDAVKSTHPFGQPGCPSPADW